MGRKDYKCEAFGFNMENKRGQLAIFIIIALVIVAIIVFLLFFRKGSPIGPTEVSLSPQNYLKTCFEDEIKKNIAELAKQGGYENPEGYLDFYGDKIKYLCYASEYYETCTVQQPLIKEHFESELNAKVKTQIGQCAQNLKKEYEKRGYVVSMQSADSNVFFNPKGLTVSVKTPMTITRDSESRSFNGFDVEMKSEMYSLLMLSVSIIDYEATYGDSETTLYMQYYPDLKIEKIRLSEGSKVYRLTNVVTNETFSFATRSLAWPPGYGILG